MHSPAEEQELIKSALGGDQRSFQRLYEIHVDSLFAFLKQFSSNRESVKDWTQRAFIKAFEKLDTFRGDAKFKSWLFRIGINEMRGDMRTKMHFENIETATIKTEAGIENDTPEKWHEAKKAIQELDPEKRMVFLLFVAEDHSHNEIAEMLNISEGASRVMLHRTKEELRKQLSNE